MDETETFRFPETEKISPPLLQVRPPLRPTLTARRTDHATQLSDVTFGYDPTKPILNKINIDVGLDSRIAVVGSNGAGKSTLIKLLTGDLSPLAGQVCPSH